MAEATVYLKCRDASDVKPVQQSVRNYLAAHAPDARCSFGVSGNVFDMIFADREAALTARLRSTSGRSADPDELQRLIDRIREALPDLEIPPVSMQEDILYIAQPEQMALYGVSFGDLIATLRNALNENTLFTVTTGDESLPVVIGNNLRSLDDLLGSTFIRTSKAEIPVSVLMRSDHEPRPEKRRRRRRGQLLSARPGAPLREVPEVISAIRSCVSADDRFEVSFSGSYFSNRGMVGQLVGVLAVALLLLFFILAAQFESLLQPWIILSEIVIDLFGALVVLRLFGQTLNLMSMIGLIVVCGIVINDSILKIDTINSLRRQGHGPPARHHGGGTTTPESHRDDLAHDDSRRSTLPDAGRHGFRPAIPDVADHHQRHDRRYAGQRLLHSAGLLRNLQTPPMNDPRNITTRGAVFPPFRCC